MQRKIASVLAMALLGLQALAGVANAGTGDECAYGSGILQVVGSSQGSSDGDVYLYVDGTRLYCEVDGNPEWDGSFAGVTQIQVEAEGEIVVDLQNHDTLAPVLFTGKTLEFAGASLYLDGYYASKSVAVTVSDSALSINGSTGQLVSAGNIEFHGGASADTFDASKLTGIDVTAYGDSGRDVLKGGDGDDLIDGEGDKDTLAGGKGDDEISTGGDGDTVLPGDGADVISGVVGAASYADSSTGVEIDASTDTVTDGAGDEDTFANGVAVWIGSAKADTFLGSSGADVFLGGNGADVARGFVGDDALSGGAGNDKLIGNAGADTLRGGTGNDKLYGRADGDTLRGDAGTDEAWGGTGGDLCGAEVTDHCEYVN